MIYRRHIGLCSRDLGDKNRKAVLEAVKTAVRRGEVPTTRLIGRMSGVYSTSTVAGHLEALATSGELKRYKYRSGTLYMPACDCCHATDGKPLL